MSWYGKQNPIVKVVAWIVGIPLSLFLLPFLIGGGLVYLMTKKLKPTKLRTASSIVLGLATALVGGIWAYAMVSGITNPQPPKAKETVVEEQKPADDQPIQVDVVKVVDGDTLDVSIQGKTERLRLIGIDTPETVDPRKTVQCFGVEASNKAKELLEGKKVTLEADPGQGERDKYSRLLRYVFLPDGQSFNKLMISEGYAYEYTYEIPYKYQVEYKQAQKGAEANKKGLWADAACQGANTKYEELKDEGRTTTTENDTIAPAVAPVVTPKTTPTPAPAPHQDKDCKDFRTQAEAQVYFNANGGSKANNFDKLDGNDRDGIVCESLP